MNDRKKERKKEWVKSGKWIKIDKIKKERQKEAKVMGKKERKKERKTMEYRWK